MNTIIKKIVSVFIGWVLFSATGAIPMKMSFPLPSFLHTYQSSLVYCGYTDENVTRQALTDEYVQKGTYNSFQFHKNGNYECESYYDWDTNEFYIPWAKGTYVINAEQGVVECEQILPDTPALTIEKNNYRYIIGRNVYPTIYSRRGSFASLEEEWSQNIRVGKSLDAVKVAALLEAQETEKIRIGDFATLLQAHLGKGFILGWYPEQHCLVGYTEERNLVVVDSLTEKKTTYDSFSDENHVKAISADEIIYYSPSKQALLKQTLSNGDIKVLAENVKTIKTLNFSYKEEELVLGGLIDEQTSFLCYPERNQYEEFDFGDQVDIQEFVFGKDTFILVDHNSDSMRYNIGTY